MNGPESYDKNVKKHFLTTLTCFLELQQKYLWISNKLLICLQADFILDADQRSTCKHSFTVLSTGHVVPHFIEYHILYSATLLSIFGVVLVLLQQYWITGHDQHIMSTAAFHLIKTVFTCYGTVGIWHTSRHGYKVHNDNIYILYLCSYGIWRVAYGVGLLLHISVIGEVTPGWLGLTKDSNYLPSSSYSSLVLKNRRVSKLHKSRNFQAQDCQHFPSIFVPHKQLIQRLMKSSSD